MPRRCPSTAPAPAPAAPPKPVAGPADGAVQILAVLQRDARLVDFLMEDISAYADDQIGAAARDVQTQGRESLLRYLRLEPVIDGVEGTFTKIEGMDPSQVKLVGNVPPSGKAPGGTAAPQGMEGRQGRSAASRAGNGAGPGRARDRIASQ